MAAIRVVVDVGLVRDDVGVGTAQLIVGDRYAHYSDRIARAPDSPLDLESLAYRAGGIFGRIEAIEAIEAIWDGDTVHDWFVRLLAIIADPADEHALATIYASTAKRHLGEDENCGPRPLAAVAAERASRALATHLSVPFHFASPDTPDDEAPRWQPATPSETTQETQYLTDLKPVTQSDAGCARVAQCQPVKVTHRSNVGGTHSNLMSQDSHFALTL